jgi:hypothetical protein
LRLDIGHRRRWISNPPLTCPRPLTQRHGLIVAGAPSHRTPAALACGGGSVALPRPGTQNRTSRPGRVKGAARRPEVDPADRTRGGCAGGGGAVRATHSSPKIRTARDRRASGSCKPWPLSGVTPPPAMGRPSCMNSSPSRHAASCSACSHRRPLTGVRAARPRALSRPAWGHLITVDR